MKSQQWISSFGPGPDGPVQVHSGGRIRIPNIPTTAIDQRTLDLLSAAHQQAVRNLLRQMRAHGLKWTRPVSSMFFEEPNLERALVPVGSVFDDSSIPRRIVDNVSYRIQISPVVDITSAPTNSSFLSPRNSDISLPSPHQSSSSASSLNFTDDILQGIDTLVDQILCQMLLPQMLPNILPLSGHLPHGCLLITRKLLGGEEILRAKSYSKSIISRKLLLDLTQQDLAFRSWIKSVRQEAQNQADITSIELKAVRAQNAVLMTDLADTRKEVQELKAALSNDILDFRAQAQENYNNLTTQLSKLVDYINRGGNDKKGESSSRGPQPPPDDRDRSGSGGSDGRNRGGRSESSRKRYLSSGGGPQRMSAEYWFGGK
ncbi:alpha-N-acetylglucosaminidase [Dorcoceras hygrometricum]|uniref:Alpha-N-acetylglucosaminidase n=1 Tax=Dorcoceras hygrometricum TaxID=472368 RepID=A0A2Z7B8G6_9LAMI|nr:alpha-N-acetylglucosaminidase [Dorcoceras hygrometricum]